MLLSLDHSSEGFIEGFGLTVLEAGKFGTPSLVLGTGGLSESCHHKVTGWVFNNFSKEELDEFVNKMSPSFYEEISKNVYEHTLNYHGLDEYKPLMRSLCEK